MWEEDLSNMTRAMAMSADEHNATQIFLQATTDDEEELLRAIALSQEEARAAKRQRKEETSEEERTMLAEYGVFVRSG